MSEIEKTESTFKIISMNEKGEKTEIIGFKFKSDEAINAAFYLTGNTLYKYSDEIDFKVGSKYHLLLMDYGHLVLDKLCTVVTIKTSVTTFEEELTHLINRHCKDNESGTHDFILANFIVNVLHDFSKAKNHSDKLKTEAMETATNIIRDNLEKVKIYKSGRKELPSFKEIENEFGDNWVKMSNRVSPAKNSDVHFVSDEKVYCGHFDGDYFRSKEGIFVFNAVSHFQYVEVKHKPQ